MTVEVNSLGFPLVVWLHLAVALAAATLLNFAFEWVALDLVWRVWLCWVAGLLVTGVLALYRGARVERDSQFSDYER